MSSALHVVCHWVGEGLSGEAHHAAASEPRTPAVHAKAPTLLGDRFPGYANKKLVTNAAGGDHLLLPGRI